jgi:hypothetical protein
LFSTRQMTATRFSASVRSGCGSLPCAAAPGRRQRTLEGKFLQLRWAGREYLLFGAATELRYHNQRRDFGTPLRDDGAEGVRRALTGRAAIRVRRVGGRIRRPPARTRRPTPRRERQPAAERHLFPRGSIWTSDCWPSRLRLGCQPISHSRPATTVPPSGNATLVASLGAAARCHAGGCQSSLHGVASATGPECPQTDRSPLVQACRGLFKSGTRPST